MKTLKVALVLGLSVLIVNANLSFDEFAYVHGKQYANVQERQKRQKIYADNVNEINRQNEYAKQNNHTAKYGVNKLSDMTKAELENSHMGLKLSPQGQAVIMSTSHIKLVTTKTTAKRPTSSTASKPTTKTTDKTTKTTTTTKSITASKPTTKSSITTTSIVLSLDWTKSTNPQVVSSVKDQGYCGSCWAFAAAETLEGYYARTSNRNVVSLSEQQLIDCATYIGTPSYWCFGCNGGDPGDALRYAINNGIETNASYPYVSGSNLMIETCTNNSAFTIIKPASAKVGYVYDEIEMMTILNNYGPFAVTINVTSLMSYMGGIVPESLCPNTNSINHAVLLVGYGTENGVDYWKLKNSWGTWWGEEGYFRLQRNQNTCSIETYNVYLYD